MKNFTQLIQSQLIQFSPVSQEKVIISHRSFTLTQAKVSDFVQEILDTCVEIEKQTQSENVAVYSQKLVEQFDCLTKAVQKLDQQKISSSSFSSNYRFPKNIHFLPREKRIIEYQKALRALNEKISWLLEQSYRCSPEEKANYLKSIEETEYRKQKCLLAIEELLPVEKYNHHNE